MNKAEALNQLKEKTIIFEGTLIPMTPIENPLRALADVLKAFVEYEVIKINEEQG